MCVEIDDIDNNVVYMIPDPPIYVYDIMFSLHFRTTETHLEICFQIHVFLDYKMAGTFFNSDVGGGRWGYPNFVCSFFRFRTP